jgi:alpha-galactosidase/6-phospho-beta-glucosidase family protein
MPLNLPAAGAVNGLPHGAIVEIDCEISALGIRALPAPPLPTGPWEMTLQLLDFERAVLSLPDVPSKRALSEALELHPLTQGHDVLQTACELATVMSKTAHCGRR